tara:strand:- start:272 stop:1141 length:870 start_codon:yes stop_codon:yes gene_type:complete
MATPTLSLSSCAVLCSLSVGIPSLELLDPAAASALTTAKHAREGRAKVVKKLVVSPHLAACKRIEGEIRAYVRSQTASYDRGRDLLPNTKLIDVKNTVRDFFGTLAHHRELFLQDYPAQVARAQLEMGDLFDEGDYPSVSDLRSKFRWAFVIEPVPESTDFRGTIEEDIRKELSEMYEANTQTRLQQAMQDVWERLMLPLRNMSARLVDKDNGKPTGFQGSLVQNVLDIVEIMRTCNFVNDPAMERVRMELRDVLSGVTVDGLKASAPLRAATKTKIDNIINNIPSLGW